jgi:hypothetical protein
MSEKLEQRREGLVRYAAETQALMECNDRLEAAIDACVEAGGQEADHEYKQAIVSCADEFKIRAAKLIGTLAILSGHIDNTSATGFLLEVTKQFGEFNIENDPVDVIMMIFEGR